MFPRTSSLLYRAHKDVRKLSHKIVGHSLDPRIDIVVVTGGCSGLGKEIVSQIVAGGTKVAVLDIRKPTNDEMIPSVIYYQCDVSKPEEIASKHERIVAELGKVTVLINNAGIANGKSILELEFADIETIIRVNLLLSFYTMKVFLPDMLHMGRGYIVTVGSVLGYMSPARLSAYGASKSGLIALHESVTYELGPPLINPHGVKTLLVCPGQMKTDLFHGVLTPSSLLAPELEPKYVAAKIVKALELGRRGEIRLPFYGNFLPVFRAAPWPLTELARYLSGMDNSVRTFRKSVSRMVSRDPSAVNSARLSPRKQLDLGCYSGQCEVSSSPMRNGIV